MTGTMTWAAMDVHARSVHAAALDLGTGEISRRRFGSGRVEPVVEWLAALPRPVHACYEAGPTGFGLYRAAAAAGVRCEVIAPSETPRMQAHKKPLNIANVACARELSCFLWAAATAP